MQSAGTGLCSSCGEVVLIGTPLTAEMEPNEQFGTF